MIPGRELIARLTSRGPETTPFTPVGRGTRSGHLPSGVRALPLDSLSGVEDLDPQEMVCTALAGTSIDEVARAAAVHGLLLCPLLPEGIGGTLGGLYSSGIESPAAPQEGRLRDAVLGIEGWTGSGSPLRSGGRVVKNVTGYDLTRYLCGARGRLGVITRLHWRLRRDPERFQEVRAELPCLRLLDALKALRGAPDATALRVELVGDRVTLRALVEGGGPPVESRIGRIREALAQAQLRSEAQELPRAALPDFLRAELPDLGGGSALRRATVRQWAEAILLAGRSPSARGVLFPWIGLGALVPSTVASPPPELHSIDQWVREAWDPHGNLWTGEEAPR